MKKETATSVAALNIDEVAFFKVDFTAFLQKQSRFQSLVRKTNPDKFTDFTGGPFVAVQFGFLENKNADFNIILQYLPLFFIPVQYLQLSTV